MVIAFAIVIVLVDLIMIGSNGSHWQVFVRYFVFALFDQGCSFAVLVVAHLSGVQWLVNDRWSFNWCLMPFGNDNGDGSLPIHVVRTIVLMVAGNCLFKWCLIWLIIRMKDSSLLWC